MITPPDASPKQTFQEGLARLLRMTRKELNESLRDRRTVITLLLMPVLLYPLLGIAFRQVLAGYSVEEVPPNYKIAFVSGEEYRSLVVRYLEAGKKALLARHGQKDLPASTKEEPEGPPHLAPLPLIIPLEAEDVDEAVRLGQVDAGVRLRPPGPFRADPRRPLAADFTVIYRKDTTKGRECAAYLERLCAEANALFLRSQLRFVMPGSQQRADPVRMRIEILQDVQSIDTGLLPNLIPLILVLMTITGAVYPSIDLTAGERERGTLEVLVAAPIPRLGVLFAKYLAVLTVAMLTALVNLLAMTITLYATGLGKTLFGTSLTLGTLLQVFALLLLFAAFFSAVLLAITSFARSFKEAQAYLIPLMLLSLTPGIIALVPGWKLNGFPVVVPLLNIVLLTRDLFDGRAALGPALLVVCFTLLYALAALGLAARIFGADAVLNSEQSGWADVFRRPSDQVATPQPSSALLCLALLFPCFFLLNNTVTLMAGWPLGLKMVISGLASVILFVGLPLLTCWLGNIKVASAFRLQPGSARPLLKASGASLLLGLGLWPFTHELLLFLRWVGVTTLPSTLLDRVGLALDTWRTFSPAFVVLMVAVVPAVTEELFFRGFFFSGFLRSPRWRMAPSAIRNPQSTIRRAILLSAALFALFHILVSGFLAVERLPGSFLLGLLLGWICYLSGSVYPGMVLHIVHNSVLVLLGYYQDWLAERGWLGSGADHLPLGLLLGAGLLSAAGLAWLAWSASRPTSEPEA
jgi:sodium transport system permease protein